MEGRIKCSRARRPASSMEPEQDQNPHDPQPTHSYDWEEDKGSIYRRASRSGIAVARHAMGEED